MKLILIFGIIIVSVLGFFIFLIYISKKEPKKEIEKIKEKDKKEVDFIKERQAINQQNIDKKEVLSITPIDEEKRGLLFEKAIARKRNNYQCDDEEYNERLAKKKQEEEALILKEQLELNPIPQELTENNFVPQKHSLSNFKKEKELEEIKKVEDTPETFPEDSKNIDSKNTENDAQKITIKEHHNIDENTNRNFRKTRISEPTSSAEPIPSIPTLEERKKEIEIYEDKKRKEIEELRKGVILEFENIRKKREHFILSSNAMASNGVS